MGCQFPLSINRETNKLLPPRIEHVPCNKCIDCRERLRASWSFRLLIEEQFSDSSTFLTLTYNEEHLPRSGLIDKKEVQDYLKRVRKICKNLRYYLVGEYGEENNRPHYHAIVFNAENNTLINQWKDPKTKEEKGFVTTDQVTQASIHYVTGYIHKKYGDIDQVTGKEINSELSRLRSFAMMSKGLGKKYIKHAKKFHKTNLTNISTWKGKNVPIPRYFRDNIFDPGELQQLKKVNQVYTEKANENYDPDLEREKRKLKKHRITTSTKKRKL